MKMRKQKLLSLLLAASLAVTPIVSAGAECVEMTAQEEITETKVIAAEEENEISGTDAEAPVQESESVNEDDFTDAADAVEDEAENIVEAVENADAPAADEEEMLLDVSEDAEDAELAGLMEEGTGTDEDAGETPEKTEVQKVEELIAALPDLKDVTEEHRTAIETALAAYNQLSEQEQKQVDTDKGTKSSQPYGRDLESAVWGLEVLKTVDASTKLVNGVYDVSSDPVLTSTYSKGKSTSKRDKKWSLKNVTVANGQAVATVTVESDSYSKIRTNGQTYEKTNESGNSEFANVPVDLNGIMYIAAYSTTMENELAFTITNTIDETATAPKKITSITNTTGMFKVMEASIERTETGRILRVTLGSTGYHEIFRGTYDEAVATGSDSSKWIVGTPKSYTDKGNTKDGYEFVIPISENDGYIQIQALSNNHKVDGYWWYPRYLKLDQKNLTLETGDYKETFDLTVTNNVKMFSVKGADLTVNGGPHSNGYAITSKVTMGSDSFDKAYIGTAAQAEAAAETIAIGEDKTFLFTVEKISGTGNSAAIDTIFGTETIFAFHSVKNQCWYERVFLFDKDAKTLVISDGTKADYAKVDAAKDKIPSDLSIYTKESADAVTAAKNAVKTGLYASQQEKVDAMAKAIEDAVAALVKKPDEKPQETPKPDEKPEAPKPDEKPAITAGDVSDKTSVAGTEQAILKQKGDEAPKGADFVSLCLKSGKVTKNSIGLKWNKVKGATGYIVYGAKCKTSFKKLAELTADKTSYTQKKLKKGTSYKYMVVAYKVENGVQKVMASSETVHIFTTGGKNGNYKSVKVNKSKVTLKKNKTFKLKATAVATSKKLKVKKHRAVKYETSNAKVATVSKKGVIKAKGKGTCYVYVYTQDGKYKKVKVTVK